MASTSQDALTVTTVAPRDGSHSRFRALARLESLRLALHPALLVGTALGIVFTGTALNDQSGQVTGDALGLPVVAATVGIGAMLAAFHLTRSFHRADELVEVAPTPVTTRTAALCLTAIVPALLASLWLVLYYGFTPSSMDAPEWMYGVFSHADIAAVLVGQSVVAAVGGTLLGIAAGRWWGFRGASAALVVAVVVWTIGLLGVFSSGDTAPAAWTRWVRLFAPVGYFSSASADGSSVMSLTGSPAWYVAWLVTLCALAAVAALLWRAEGKTRRQVVRAGAVVLALSLLTYGLAVSGGPSQPVRTFPDGHSVVVTK